MTIFLSLLLCCYNVHNILYIHIIDFIDFIYSDLHEKIPF